MVEPVLGMNGRVVSRPVAVLWLRLDFVTMLDMMRGAGVVVHPVLSMHGSMVRRLVLGSYHGDSQKQGTHEKECFYHLRPLRLSLLGKGSRGHSQGVRRSSERTLSDRLPRIRLRAHAAQFGQKCA